MLYQYPVRVRGVGPCEEQNLEADCPYQPVMKFGQDHLMPVVMSSIREVGLLKSCPTRQLKSTESPAMSGIFIAVLLRHLRKMLWPRTARMMSFSFSFPTTLMARKTTTMLLMR